MASILVVDDETALLGLVTMILNQNGHNVLGAASAVEALMIFASYRSSIDLVLTDIMMPGMSGIELSERLRAINPAIRILLMSGFVPDDISIPPDFKLLMKPFPPERLIEAVEQTLTASPATESH